MRHDASIGEELEWTRAALADPGEAGQWRIWRYGRAEIVFGCSQRRLLEQLERACSTDLPVFRRASGGGVVFAGPWLLGLTVVLPDAHPLLTGHTLVDSYRWLGELHVRVLAGAGVDARALDPADTVTLSGSAGSSDAGIVGVSPDRHSVSRAPIGWACFGGLSPWEVVDAQGRKLTGLSQRRVRGAVAFSAGTLLSRPPWQQMCDAVGAPSGDGAALDAYTGACDENAPMLQADDWAVRFAAAVRECLGEEWSARGRVEGSTRGRAETTD